MPLCGLLLMGLAVMIFVHYSGRTDYRLTLIEAGGVGLDEKHPLLRHKGREA